MEETKHALGSPEYRHEPDELDVRQVVFFGIGLLVAVGVLLVLMNAMFNYLGTSDASGASRFALVDRHLPPRPRLQVTPAQDLKSKRDSEDLLLNSYGWVDKQAGIVRIPIDRAIEVVAQKGLPVRAPSRDLPARKK